MEHRKLDAKLSEALANASGSAARYEVFIELSPEATADNVASLSQLEQIGVTSRGATGGVVTARVNAETLSAVSDLPAVRYVRLRRRLRTSASWPATSRHK